ncbi:sensor histidine kinase [Streptococcus sp. NLN76]|uniref:sensor histidine kinase n=1 Tax=Streptococcus sp. NLN76 TaxID=2822800 RepID=UPI0018AADF58|nr:sensor histidine kinase [Streptococcus sp. NLN76]MBF8970541.1 sensor histidine kinase [Streptococcus sp. NLN76]
MKPLFFHRLLKSYSVLVIGIIIFFTAILSYSTWLQYEQSRLGLQQEVADILKVELDDYQGRVGNYLADYLTDSKHLEAYYRYFQESPSQYQSWLLDQNRNSSEDISLQDAIRTLYLYYPFVKGLDLVPVEGDTVFVSNQDHKSGRKLALENYQAPENSLTLTLLSPVTTEGMATVYVTVDQQLLDDVVLGRSSEGLRVRVQDSLDRLVYQYGREGQSLFQTRRSSGDLEISVAFLKSAALTEMGSLIAVILFGGLFLASILLWFLRRVFRQYEIQVEDIVTSIQAIASSEEDLRIRTDNKQQEMLMIASEINEMLDSRDQHTQAIYRLQLAQKDANMRALQAQINPHFLYNTLEFFRMYAVSKEMEELGDLIYEFSSLLRGNVSPTPWTSVADEIAFCEKHSYICQMRYPKSIAYAFQIEAGCENLKIPRFTLQPLVENYFVHGLDLRRRDNALSLKASKEGQSLILSVRDNGKGMSGDTLAVYQDLFSKRQLSQENRLRSIGLINVHERLLLSFGDRYQMELGSELNQGTWFKIQIDQVFEEGGQNA